MKRIITSICCLPIAFFIARYANIACEFYLKTLKAADPDFPHTAIQMAQRSALDASIVLPLLTVSMCGTWVMFSIFKYIDQRNAEALKRKLEAQK